MQVWKGYRRIWSNLSSVLNWCPPPSFLNIMTHLLVHLVDEIAILGPVFLHNMFPFKRFMGVLKKYVRNRARSEGSISKGYGTEEVIEFCVDFIPDLKPIGVA